MTLSDNPIRASWLYLLDPEIRFLEAAVEHLIPSDELGPGARDAGVVVYIDRQLAGFWGTHGRMYRGGPWLEGTPQQGYQSRFTPQEVYRIAIREIDQHCRAEFDRPFAQLAHDSQLRLLEQLEKDEIALPSLSSKFFFDLLWRNTEEGISPILCTAATATKWVGSCSASPACHPANTATSSQAVRRTTPNPSACSTSRPVRCRSMRKAFRSTSSSSATATRKAEMSATKLKSVDVVVVGSGVVGSIMSMELASAGLNVVCLERGRSFDVNTDFYKPNVYDELKFDRHSDIFQNLARDTITFRNNDAQTALPMREMGAFKPGEMVGGTGAHWGGNARRFLPHDFEMRSRIKERYGDSFIPEDCHLQDWGVTWDDIEPYYDQFEEIFGVGGKAGNLDGEIQTGGNPHEGPRSREYPNPPTRRTHEGALFADAVSSLGYVPFQGPTAAMTADDRKS